MSTRRLLIINNDPKNLRILTSHFVEHQYQVDEALNDTEASDKIKNYSYDGLLTEVSAPGIDGYQILADAQSSERNQSCAVFFLTQKADSWNRLKSFKLGIKDYIIKPIHVKEIVARVDMVLNRIERRRQQAGTLQPVFIGRLEELSLFELIEIFGLKRKTGLLRLYNDNNCSGQVAFKDGAVIHANASNHLNEEAIYKMMAWRKGRFSMLFSEPPARDEIAVSNMGLLLQGAKRMQQREQLLRQLPSLNAVLVTTSEFKKIVTKKALAPDLAYFVSLFDGEHSLGRIIDESKYDEILTLERILKLYELGFLHTLRDFKSPISSEMAPPPEDAASLFDGLEKEEASLDDDLFPGHGSVAEAAEELLTQPEPMDREKSFPADRPGSPPSNRQEEASLSRDLPPTGIDDLMETEMMPPEEDSPFPANLLYDLDVPPSFETPSADSHPLDSGGEALYSPLDFLDDRHPADALLSIRPETSFEESDSRPPRATPPPTPPPAEKSADIVQLEREWKIQERFRRARGGVIILCSSSQSRKEMVSSLANGRILEKKIYNGQISDLYLGTAEFKGGGLLNVIGVALDREFTSVIDFFADSILGYLVVMDQENTSWNYYRYLIGFLREKTGRPFMVVATRLINNEVGGTLEFYRSKLGLAENESITICSEWSPLNSRRVLFSLFNNYPLRPQPPMEKQNTPASMR